MRLKTVILLALACVLTSCAEVAYAQNQSPRAYGNITASGSSCTTTPTACVTLAFPNSQTGASVVSITGTWIATVQFEASSDGGDNWVAINSTPPNSTTAVTSATANGTWQANVAGFTNIRVRCSAFTSGTIVVVINSASVSARSGGTSLPALSDNGTYITSTEPIAAPQGTQALPGFTFSGNHATGIFGDSATPNQVRISSNNSLVATFGGTSVFIGSGGLFFDTSTGDANIARVAARSLRCGLANSATPGDCTFTFGESARGGTDTDVSGAPGIIKPGIGTGTGSTGTKSKIAIQRNLVGATSSTAQSQSDGFVVGQTKTLSNSTAQTAALATISVPSNSSGGSSGTINVSCNDGTNFDSETVSFVVSYVNKATVLTIGTVQLTTASTANNSGSCTTAVTATAGTNSVNINVTPVITTIVPTTVTGTVLSLSSYATGNVTIN